MSDTSKPRRQWFLSIQSSYVLPLARGVYLLIALASLLAVISGIVYLLFLKASVSGEPALEPLPPAYQQSGDGVDMPPRDVDPKVVEQRLDAPSGIRFTVTAGTITAPLREGTVLGHFQANTLNGLAPFPEGISILGGRDAELFDRVRGTGSQLIGLAPRPALLAEIAQTLQGIQEKQTRAFDVRVVARDKYGITSTPADLSFELTFAPPPPSKQAETQVVPPEAATELQKIARDIAKALEPTVNPAHFAVYRAAMETPGRCGARDDDVAFLANYRRTFDNAKPRLTAANIAAFYAGLCDAWKAVLDKEAALRNEAQEQRSLARAAAEQARARVEAGNDQRLAEHAAKVAAAEAQTRLTLSVMGGALGVFLSVSLVLAFLAIEGHSRAMRAAAESMVRLAEQRDAKSSPEPGADA